MSDLLSVPDLRECPFCGGRAELVVSNVEGENAWRVECFRDPCGATMHALANGPGEDTAEIAAAKWNRRDARPLDYFDDAD